MWGRGCPRWPHKPEIAGSNPVTALGDQTCNLALALAPDPVTHYVIVRDDLSRGVLAAQVTHAAGESSPGNLSSGTYAVVLSAKSAEELLEIRQRLKAANVSHVLIEEEGEPMAIGVQPDLRNNLRRYFSSLPLLR